MVFMSLVSRYSSFDELLKEAAKMQIVFGSIFYICMKSFNSMCDKHRHEIVLKSPRRGRDECLRLQ